MKLFSGSRTFRKSLTKRGSSVIAIGLAVVGDRELDARLADFGSLAGEDEAAFAEREIDAAAFFAGDDRGLADGGVNGADAEVDLHGSWALRENIAPARVAAFEEPRVDRGSWVFDEDIVLANRRFGLRCRLRRGPVRAGSSHEWGRRSHRRTERACRRLGPGRPFSRGGGHRCRRR